MDTHTTSSPPAMQELRGWFLRLSLLAVLRWILGSCLLLALTAFAPWDDVTQYGIVVKTVSGTTAGGWDVPVCAVVIALLTLDPAWMSGMTWIVRHAPTISLILAWLELFNVGATLAGIHTFADGGGEVTPRWGLYLGTLIAVSLVVALHARRAHLNEDPEALR